MRTKAAKLSAVFLVLVLSTAPFAAPALARDRDGSRRDSPLVRVMKQILRRFGIAPNGDELSVPRP